VLWDQIEYMGAPQDFAWVMPVKTGAVLEAASDAWLEALDAGTTPNVRSPELICEASGAPMGCGCGSAGDRAGGGPDQGFGDQGGVTVVHQGTAGPYDTVTLSSSTPGAVTKWLTDNGYNIPSDIQPILDDYTTQGLDFI